MTKPNFIDSFELEPGRILAQKYEVASLLGSGWEGEVYKIRERKTGIERAAKLFFPARNQKNKTAMNYARRLHNLRHCPVVVQYHAEETLTLQRLQVTALISEYVEGKPLSEFLRQHPGQRIRPFQALHLLHALASGLECIHAHDEYHGDLHPENIMVLRRGLHFDLKLMDLFLHQSVPKRENMHDDVYDIIHIFYHALGGSRFYAKHPPVVKQVCLGLRSNLIRKKFPSAKKLRAFLETLQW